MSSPQQRGATRSAERDFRSTAKQLERFEVSLHDLLHWDDTLQLELDDLLAARTMASSCWAIVKMLCEHARIELPSEPDWFAILDEVNEAAAVP
ncbi:hypothetical protein [Lysobacter antibioticus]|uniref:Uncharacterized protein n=1 Tax=Lysobacter antibioticus TaxID=84531 RepID=A0A0S2F4X2_LYSAN|nr:hypothetical protein [Lysobacter antibioticus]ALN78585.1 hypothetical protein LA76x_0424 [Lysobacter antibioticus]